MKRDSLEQKSACQPLLGRILHECSGCKRVGIKPDALATHLGDYGMREWIRDRYQDLILSPEGLCARCTDVPGTSE